MKWKGSSGTRRGGGRESKREDGEAFSPGGNSSFRIKGGEKAKAYIEEGGSALYIYNWVS